MKVLILGAGYSGLNVYYNLKKEKKINIKIISEDKYFKYYTLFFRSALFGKTFPRLYLNFVEVEKVKDVDFSAPMVITDKGNKYEPDLLIISTGCKRKLEEFVKEIGSRDKVKIGVEDKFDEYLALQLVFYLKKLGRDVEYCGSYLDWLGKEVSEKVKEIIDLEGIRTCEIPTIYFPPCEPSLDFGFLSVNENLKVNEYCFAIGDIVKDMPKVGELAMREGIYVAKFILGVESKPFSPIFINILETPSGKGLHIRSNKLWGGNFVSVKYSRVRSIMKRFIELYYTLRKGNMGILSRL
ncbi:MAG: pyridine nucleotide-disulfide oxidoreductase [Sulfolobaceae archaeon]